MWEGEKSFEERSFENAPFNFPDNQAKWLEFWRYGADDEYPRIIYRPGGAFWIAVIYNGVIKFVLYKRDLEIIPWHRPENWSKNCFEYFGKETTNFWPIARLSADRILTSPALYSPCPSALLLLPPSLPLSKTLVILAALCYSGARERKSRGRCKGRPRAWKKSAKRPRPLLRSARA